MNTGPIEIVKGLYLQLQKFFDKRKIIIFKLGS